MADSRVSPKLVSHGFVEAQARNSQADKHLARARLWRLDICNFDRELAGVGVDASLVFFGNCISHDVGAC
jgi:hypothetical protein